MEYGRWLEIMIYLSQVQGTFCTLILCMLDFLSEWYMIFVFLCDVYVWPRPPSILLCLYDILCRGSRGTTLGTGFGWMSVIELDSEVTKPLELICRVCKRWRKCIGPLTLETFWKSRKKLQDVEITHNSCKARIEEIVFSKGGCVMQTQQCIPCTTSMEWWYGVLYTVDLAGRDTRQWVKVCNRLLTCWCAEVAAMWWHGKHMYQRICFSICLQAWFFSTLVLCGFYFQRCCGTLGIYRQRSVSKSATSYPLPGPLVAQ